VSIHDVAPATWPDCLRLVQAIRAVADIPLTWLVVPHYHFRPERSAAMEAGLDTALARGDELALHGYSHLDTEANGGGLRARFLRNVYTRREGEFAALSHQEARRRLDLGLAWFAERGWTPSGFVPPAWLLGEGAWQALRESPFAYTTTFSHFHVLNGGGGAVDGVRGAQPQRPLAVAAGGGRHGRDAGGRAADTLQPASAGCALPRIDAAHPARAGAPAGPAQRRDQGRVRRAACRRRQAHQRRPQYPPPPQ
jgi:predicted deacetylase